MKSSLQIPLFWFAYLWNRSGSDNVTKSMILQIRALNKINSKFNLINRENAHLISSPTSLLRLWYSWFPFNNFQTDCRWIASTDDINLYICLSLSFEPSPGLKNQPHLQFTFHTSSRRRPILSFHVALHCTSVAVHTVNSTGDRLRYSHPTEDDHHLSSNQHAASKGLSILTRGILQLAKNSYHKHRRRVLSCLLGHSLFVVNTLVTQLN